MFDELFRSGRAPLYLAPMSGFTDIAFRALCKEQGADALVSEFVQSEPLIRARERAWRDVDFTPAQRPMGIQIFGAVPASMAAAAKLLEERLHPDFIDLNFGCPARKVVEQNAGSGLLRDLPLMEKIARAVVEAVPATPVTAKIRLGWDSASLVHVEAARRLEDAGIRAIAVHGRTRAQGYSGEADWEKIAEVVRAAGVPVIGNGDVRDAATAVRRVRESGVRGLMIGRGALGNPWIFSQIKNALAADGNAAASPESGKPPPEIVFSTMLRYAKALAGTRMGEAASCRFRGDSGTLRDENSSEDAAAVENFSGNGNHAEATGMSLPQNMGEAASRRFRENAGTENIRWLLARLHPFTYGVPAGKRVRAALSSCDTLDDLARLLEKTLAEI